MIPMCTTTFWRVERFLFWFVLPEKLYSVWKKIINSPRGDKEGRGRALTPHLKQKVPKSPDPSLLFQSRFIRKEFWTGRHLERSMGPTCSLPQQKRSNSTNCPICVLFRIFGHLKLITCAQISLQLLKQFQINEVSCLHLLSWSSGPDLLCWKKKVYLESSDREPI